MKELTKVECFIKNVWVCLFPCGYWRSKRCWYVRLLNVTMVFEFMILSGSNTTALRPILRQLFVSLLFFDNLYMFIKPFLVILCDTFFLRSKFIFITFESANTYKFLYMKDASFSRKILLKLIHFKSRNSVWKSGPF